MELHIAPVVLVDFVGWPTKGVGCTESSMDRITLSDDGRE